MQFIFWGIGGFLGGFIFAFISDLFHRSYGIIDVDHHNNTCQVHMTSDEIKNPKTKKVVFTINHNAHIRVTNKVFNED